MAWHFIGLFVMVVIYSIFRYRNDDVKETDNNVDKKTLAEDKNRTERYGRGVKNEGFGT